MPTALLSSPKAPVTSVLPSPERARELPNVSIASVLLAFRHSSSCHTPLRRRNVETAPPLGAEESSGAPLISVAALLSDRDTTASVFPSVDMATPEVRAVTALVAGLEFRVAVGTEPRTLHCRFRSVVAQTGIHALLNSSVAAPAYRVQSRSQKFDPDHIGKCTSHLVAL